MRARNTDYWYGEDGLDDHPETYPPADSITDDMVEKESAVSALIRLVKQYSGAIDLIATGPLTNIALALNIDPSLPARLKSFTTPCAHTMRGQQRHRLGH